jgi:hypothetical protein
LIAPIRLSTISWEGLGSEATASTNGPESASIVIVISPPQILPDEIVKLLILSEAHAG